MWITAIAACKPVRPRICVGCADRSFAYLLADNPGWAPWRPVVGIAPRLSDAELVTLAVISALLGYDNESQFVRFAREHLGPWFPYLPNRAGFNKRLRASAGSVREFV